MIFFVLFAFAVCLAQILLITAPARTLTWRYMVIAFGTGLGVASLVLLVEYEITKLLLGTADVSFPKAVRAASYLQDPLIEEVGKALPLTFILLFPAVRRRLSYVDILVLAVGLGAGFGFFEAALTVGSQSGGAHYRDNSFFFSHGFGPILVIPDPWLSITSWLPAGYYAQSQFKDIEGQLNSHVVYSVFFGAGVAYIAKDIRKFWIGVPLIVYAIMDHMGFNAHAAHYQYPIGASHLLNQVRNFDRLLIFGVIIIVCYADIMNYRTALLFDECKALRLDRKRAIRIAVLALSNWKKLSVGKNIWAFLLERRKLLLASLSGDLQSHAASAKRLVTFLNWIDGGQAGPWPPAVKEGADRQPPSIWLRLARLVTVVGIVALGFPVLIYWSLIGVYDYQSLKDLYNSPSIMSALLSILTVGIGVQVFSGVLHARALFIDRARDCVRAVVSHGLGLWGAVGGAIFGGVAIISSMGVDPFTPFETQHAIEHWLQAHPVAAITLAIAATIIGVLVPLAIAVFLPEVSLGIGVAQAITGRDALTGQKLSLIERVLGAIPGGKTERIGMSAESTALRRTGSRSILGSADEAYDAIRTSSTDVARIASNTGYKASNIQKVKNHLFMSEQLLDRYESLGIPATRARFDSDIGIAEAWRRLESGTHGPVDLQLLRHETAEAWYMRNVSPGYNAAHNAAQRRFPVSGF